MCVKTNHRLLGQLYTQKWLIFHLGNLTPAKIEEHWLRPPLLPEKLPMQSPLLCPTLPGTAKALLLVMEYFT